MAIREQRWLVPLIVLFGRARELCDFDRYHKLISGNFAFKQRVIEITIGDLTKLHLKRVKLKIERTDRREKIGSYYRRAHGNIRIVGQFLKNIGDRRPG
jgi:hypothetical protein